MLYKIRDWDKVACCINTHPLIFEKPIYPEVIRSSLTNTLSSEDLAKFLDICDLSGTRKETNRQLYWEQIRSDIAEDYDLVFWEWFRGKKYADSIVDDYIERHELMKEGQCPVWRKPMVWRVPTETFRWKYNEVYRCLECINEGVLNELAKKCDILVCGNTVHTQYVVLGQPNAKPVYPVEDTGPSLMPQIIGRPSPEFLEKYPKYHYVKYDLEAVHYDTFKPVEPLYMTEEDEKRTMTFEDKLLFGSFRKGSGYNSMRHLTEQVLA